MTSGARGGDGGQPGAGEIVQFGRPTRPRRFRPRALALACLVAAAVVVVIVRSGGPTGGASRPPAIVTDVGHRILGIRGGWELFGLDRSGLVSVQFSQGRIVRTTIPGLAEDGIVSLVAAPGDTLVRPVADVPGYVVPDGKPAQPLSGALAHGGYLLPGPTPAEQWLDSHDLNLLLVGPGGKPEHAHLPQSALRSAAQAPVISDGHGGLILTGASGTVYDATGGALRLVGALPIAVGPRDWLAMQCDTETCRNVVISAATGISRTLPGLATVLYPWPWQALPGVTAPDGAAAAVIVPGTFETRAWLDLISLGSGAERRVRVPVARGSASESLAWSPDSRWLFVVTAHGTLAIVDARTGVPQQVNLGLSGLSQIVIRPASG